MAAFTCPGCGAPVSFRSAAPYCVCGHCQSLLVRTDAGLENIGKVAEVPQDFSPFQLGTEGRFEGRPFTLVGRVRKAWAEGSWSEWCAHFADQALGWLGEAQGDYVMLFEQPPQALRGAIEPASLRQAAPGTGYTIGGRPFAVSDVKQVRLVGAEGELVGVGGAGAPMVSIDLQGAGADFATIELADAGDVQVYLGRYVDFDEMHFARLRSMEGWAPPAPA